MRWSNHGSGERATIRVLGAVDLLTSVGVVPVKGRMERMLLATLVLSANHTVSADQLAQILWGDDPPPSRDNTLQTYVSRLRRLLGGDRIVWENRSYLLEVEVDEVDALRFETLVGAAMEARGDPRRCLGLCRAALELWRGVPFGELADEDPFRLEAIRLEEIRLYAMELQIEAELALGRSEMVVSTLEPLVEEYPYRERMWYLLIAALSKSGRRVEALRAFRRLTEILAEVGLSPTLDLCELEDRVVLEDPAVRPRLHEPEVGAAPRR